MLGVIHIDPKNHKNTPFPNAENQSANKALKNVLLSSGQWSALGIPSTLKPSTLAVVFMTGFLSLKGQASFPKQLYLTSPAMRSTVGSVFGPRTRYDY